ncbi:hypothetical protein FQN54_003941 [Arachnomyces sp. PD_36]|nr:hypothetical protein FQN54_003941 [Arachnomyces sp. PD_36]
MANFHHYDPRLDDGYRPSLSPGSKPYRMDHRGITAHDIDAALEHARYGLHAEPIPGDGSRYTLGGNGVPVPLPSRAPYTSARFDDNGNNIPYGGSNNTGHNQHQHQQPPRNSIHHEIDLNETVRKTNLAVALANHNISHRAQFSQIHPMMCPDGRFPVDFQIPRTVESVKLFDNTQLDRILQAYRLPFENRVLLALSSSHHQHSPHHHHSSRGGSGGGSRDGGDISSSRMRQIKLQVLFEHLGAVRIVEHEKLKRVAFA